MNNYYLTPKQFSVLVKNLVWMTSSLSHPSKEYVEWWDTISQRKLMRQFEEKIGKLNIDQASELINLVLAGNWEGILAKLRALMPPKFFAH